MASEQIPIFVINLDRSAVRLDRIAARLAELGLSFERVPAIDGSMLSPDEKQRFSPNRSWIVLHDAEIGCYLSHLKVLRLIAERELPRAIVLEDDAIFEPDFAVWASGECPMPPDTDLLKLEGFGAKNCLKLPVSAYAHRNIVFSYRHTGGTAAYVITLEGARKALRNLTHARGQLDYDLFLWRNGLRVCDVTPYPARQDGTGSTIHRAASERSLRMKIERWFLKSFDKAGRLYASSRRSAREPY